MIEDTIRLVGALVMSIIAYSPSYHHLTNSDEEQVNIILRSTYKSALKLPRFTATEKIEEPGLYNTIAEIKEAALSA